MGNRQENCTIKKIILCANQKVNSVVVKEISDIHSSQNRHHKKVIKYSFVLQTMMSCVCNVYVLSLLSWILQALCPMLAEHAEVKVNATDNGFKLTLCALGGGKKNKSITPNMHT